MGKEGMEGGVTRRSVLRKILGGALAGAGVLETAGSFRAEKENVLRMLNDRDLKESSQVIAVTHRYIQSRYGVDVKINFHFFDEIHRMSPLTPQEVRECLRFLVDGLSKYPNDFFTINKLPEIHLAKDLMVIDEKSQQKTYAGGVAMHAENRIVLTYSPNWYEFEGVLDHEIFHILDDREGWSDAEFEEWYYLHQDVPVDPYGDVEQLHKNHLLRRNNLFARPYGAASSAEDRATIAQAILEPYRSAELREKINHLKGVDELSSTILSKKVELIRKEYFAWSGGSMNEQFFDLIEQEGKKILDEQDAAAAAEGHGEIEKSSYDMFEDFYETYFKQRISNANMRNK